MKSNKLTMEFNIEEANNGFFISSEDISDFAIWISGHDVEKIQNVFHAAMPLYTLQYGLETARCLLDIPQITMPLEDKQKIIAHIVLK